MSQFERDHKLVIKEEDKAVFEEQKAVGAVMDTMTKRELWLKKHKDTVVGDDSLMLYRLPLNEEQMGNVFSNIINAAKE